MKTIIDFLNERVATNKSARLQPKKGDVHMKHKHHLRLARETVRYDGRVICRVYICTTSPCHYIDRREGDWAFKPNRKIETVFLPEAK